MTRTTTSRPAARVRTLALLGGLAVLVTAGAPSVITIRSGDTLWDLARAHGTTVGELQRLNNLPGNGTIYAGNTLRLPGGSTSTQKGLGTYTVRPGDTLSHLAVRYGGTVSSIQQANGLSSTRIRTGQRLRLAGGGKQLSSVPTVNAGKRIPQSVRSGVAANRATLAARSHPSKSQVRRMVAATAKRHGVSPSLAVSVAFHESGFQQRVVSGVNAIGVMQVLPSTGRVLGQQTGRRFDLLDTQDNITAGVLLLRQLLRSTGSEDKALAGYYQGLGSISRKGLLPQTHTYLKSIDALRARFRNG